MTKKITPESDREKLVSKKIREVSAFAEMVPGVIIIHELPEFTLRYMSPLGLQSLGKEWNEMEDMSSEEYHKRFFNPDFASDSVPKILGIIEKNTDELVSFFQQVRTSRDREWDWYMTATKILLRDRDNNPLLTISVAMKIDPESYFTSKGARLLEENKFLRTNHDKFSRLTKRERQILQLMVFGKSAAEIGKELAITVATAETHRKKIKHKLGAKNSYDLSQFARAFDIL